MSALKTSALGLLIVGALFAQCLAEPRQRRSSTSNFNLWGNGNRNDYCYCDYVNVDSTNNFHVDNYKPGCDNTILFDYLAWAMLGMIEKKYAMLANTNRSKTCVTINAEANDCQSCTCPPTCPPCSK